MLAPAGVVLASATEWGRQLSRHPAQAVIGIKQSLTMNRDRDLKSGTERDSILSQWIFEGPDAREGHKAFVEKREPCFSHESPPLPAGLDRTFNPR